MDRLQQRPVIRAGGKRGAGGVEACPQGHVGGEEEGDMIQC